MQNFQCYQLSLGAVRMVRPLIERIETHDRDLGRQLRRCVSSVPLNVAEGSRSAGRNRQARYANAQSSGVMSGRPASARLRRACASGPSSRRLFVGGSARESTACLETAEALGYLAEDDLPMAVDRLDHIVAILFKLCR